MRGDRLDTVRTAHRDLQSGIISLLSENGFDPHDIIFDPNVLAIATGIVDHANYAVRFHTGHPLD